MYGLDQKRSKDILHGYQLNRVFSGESELSAELELELEFTRSCFMLIQEVKLSLHSLFTFASS